MDSDKIIDLSRWMHLRSLKLHSESFQNNACDYPVINFESIKHLHVDAIGFEFQRDAYAQKQLFTFLQKCIHLEYLNFPGFTLLISWNLSNDLQFCKLECMKHIKGLRTTYQDILIDSCQRQLESLHLYGDSPDFIQQYAFPHLKELWFAPFPSNSTQTLTAICNSGCGKLERLHIVFGAFPSDHERVLERLFSLGSLNYISIHIDKRIEEILQALIKSLLSASKSRMKIRIDSSGRLSWDDKNMDQLIMKLIETASAHVTKDWMFIFDYARMSIKDTKGVQELVQWTRKMNRKLNNRYFFTLNHKYCQNLQSDILEPDMQLIISNYECGINGYKEKWIYDYGCICEHCTL
eukprot:57299_1